MTVQTYKYLRVAADANGSYDVGDIVQLDDAGGVAIALLAAGEIVKISPVDGSSIPPDTDPPPIS